MSALLGQVGGSHYKDMPYQPIQLSMKLRLNACQHTAIKYISRYERKGAPEKDLTKALHCLELAQELDWLADSWVGMLLSAFKARGLVSYQDLNGLSIEQAEAIWHIVNRQYEKAKLPIAVMRYEVLQDKDRIIDEINRANAGE